MQVCGRVLKDKEETLNMLVMSTLKLKPKGDDMEAIPIIMFICSLRLEAERLQERQEMMEELQAMKMAAEQEMTMQKQTYEDRLRTLEGTLVSVLGDEFGMIVSSLIIG